VEATSLIPVGVEGVYKRPYSTVLIVAVNVAVFILYFLQGPRAFNEAVVKLGFTPVNLLRTKELHTIFTSMFMHGDALHLLSNMLYLYVFGGAVEARMGSARFLPFYMACGVAAAYIHSFVELASQRSLNVPCVGASGAISGVLGAYLLLFPWSSVRIMAFSLLGLPIIVPLPAALFLITWFALQLWMGFTSLRLPFSLGVAFWAHVGGFLAGMLLASFLRRRRMVVFSGRVWYEVPVRALGVGPLRA
jgi:membrane associated rhomboid family serine protease